MVLGHGHHAFGRGVVRHLPDGLGQGGDEALIAAVVFPLVAGGDVVAHPGRAQQGGDVHIVLHPLDFLLLVAVAAVEEIRPNGQGGELQPALLRGLLQLQGLGLFLLLGAAEVHKVHGLHSVKAQLRRLFHTSQGGELPLLDGAVKAVQADRILHAKTTPLF